LRRLGGKIPPFRLIDHPLSDRSYIPVANLGTTCTHELPYNIRSRGLGQRWNGRTVLSIDYQFPKRPNHPSRIEVESQMHSCVHPLYLFSFSHFQFFYHIHFPVSLKLPPSGYTVVFVFGYKPFAYQFS